MIIRLLKRKNIQNIYSTLQSNANEARQGMVFVMAEQLVAEREKYESAGCFKDRRDIENTKYFNKHASAPKLAHENRLSA
jgi:hypothetical protein